MKLGVLAIQGSFALHIRSLGRLGVEPVEVRRAHQLDDLDGIILPGGESTTFSIVLNQDNLGERLIARLESGLPVWGTCAGAIILGRGEGIPPRWGMIGVDVARNSYGRQVDSFVAPLDIDGFDHPFDGVFIRAPGFSNLDPDVVILARFNHEPVMARQGSRMITAFHPELTDDLRVHRFFVEQICSSFV